MVDRETRTTRLPARRLSPRVIEGLEKRASIPVAKLPEIVQLRAIVRDLIAHINWYEGLGQEVAGQ